MYARYLPEGAFMPKSEDRFEELYSLIQSYDENGDRRAISARISYIEKEHAFSILDFGQGVKGWLSGAQSAIDEKSKGYLHVGDIIDVEIEGYNDEKHTFVCSRRNRVNAAIQYQKEHYEVGMIIPAKVTKSATYGYFVDIGGGNTVLLHKSEISTKYVKSSNHFFNLGQLITVKITGLNPKFNTFTVSYKDVTNSPELRIGNTVAVELETPIDNCWTCHLAMDPSIKGRISGKKQNANYQPGDVFPADITGFRDGLRMVFI